VYEALAKKSTANQPYAMPFPMVNINQYNNNDNNHVYFRQSPYEIKKESTVEEYIVTVHGRIY